MPRCQFPLSSSPAKPLKSSWLWRASLQRQGIQFRWIHSTNDYCCFVWNHHKWLENNWLTFRFALLTCPMKLSGGLGELEILEMVKLDFCILLWPFFLLQKYALKPCLLNIFYQYIPGLNTLVWPMIRRWPNMWWTRQTSMQPSPTTPQGETFSYFLSETSSIYTWPVTNACLTCLPYWFASKTCLMWPWACSNSPPMWPHVTSCDPCDVPICPTFSTFYNLVFQQRKFNMLWTL